MEETNNTLVIIALNTKEDDLIMSEQYYISSMIEVVLESKLEFYCSVTGNLVAYLNIESNGVGHNYGESVKNCIQNFIDGNFISHMNFYGHVRSESTISNKVHNLKVSLPEPLKSFFIDLFDVSNWSIANKELN